ncbi:hypothetical protein CEY00_Acc09191 [Actinidia chinensis var. chinensis]|uniref:Late embryogenesis abundant protein LEA-2 subgroup domain-containing protein n=1 Tax=Actinidia chinensis var. chinensis TaxID=1590841 RepID=A0A2R6R9M2_ACTCC|nr:hypothetical protein CEY00_Acc09191 [Actinidia chinensis var. chinensis]
MAEQAKPILQKPPGYRDPGLQAHAPSSRPPPPRKPVLPMSFRPRKRGRSCCLSCCCYTFLLLLLLLIVVAIAGCCFYLWYQPRMPVFHLQSLRFTRFKITTGPDGPTLTSEAVVRVEVRNPNHALKINYANTVVSLNTDGVDLGTSPSPEFTQAKMNTTVLKFTVPAKNQLVANVVAQRLTGGFRTKRLVVATEVRTGIGVGTDAWSTMRPSVKVVCGGMTLKAIEGGAVPKCKITVFKWINIIP